jgi:hypothetical protein
VEAAKNQAIMQFGEEFAEAQKYLNLEYQAWERLILLHEAKKRGIKTSDKEVIELIESYPIFERRGQFDNRVYSEMLRYVLRTSPRVFEEQTRQNLTMSKLYKQVTDGIKVDDEETKQEYRKLNEEVSIYYIAGAPLEFAQGLNPSEDQLKEYFAKNALEFKQPLSFNIEYTSSDSEDKIKGLSLRLKRKTDFTKATGELGLEMKKSGLFAQTDSIPGIGWSPQVMELISKLKVGQFSPTIYSDKKYYILSLKEIKEPYIPDFENIKDKAKEVFVKNKSKELAQSKMEGCLQKLKEQYEADPKSADFDKAAASFGLKSASTDLFKYGGYIEGIGVTENFWAIAQSLKEGSFSGIIYMPSGFYIVKLKTRVPIDEEKFKSEKEEFAKKVLSQKRQEEFTKFIEELRKKSQLF